MRVQVQRRISSYWLPSRHPCESTKRQVSEDLFRCSKDYEAKSAGTHLFAEHRLTQELIDWADKIFVMSELEDGHLTFLETDFDLKGKPVHDLDIPDRYERGSQELISLLASRISRQSSSLKSCRQFAYPPTAISARMPTKDVISYNCWAEFTIW